MPEEIQFGKTDRYNSHPSGVECIEVAEEFNFNLGNVIKYIWRSRYGDDDQMLQLKKAEQYLHREIVRLNIELNGDDPGIKTYAESAGSQARKKLSDLEMHEGPCQNGAFHAGHEWNSPTSGVVYWCRGRPESIDRVMQGEAIGATFSVPPPPGGAQR